MVDFIFQKEFLHKDVQSVGKTSKVSADNVLMSAYCYDMPEQVIFLGLTNGEIYYYKAKGIDGKSIFLKNKQFDVFQIESPHAHKGSIRKLIYTKMNDGKLDVLISASSDRTVKLWEPKNTKGNPCFQTIVGHEGSILDMAYIEKVQQLITSSTDRTMRIWIVDQARQLLLYPWFVINQRIQDFTSNNITNEIDIWINTIDVQDSENLAFHAGDSEGSLLTFKASENWRQECIFSLAGDKKRGMHKFGIIQILDVMKKESCIFTIGFDQTIKGFGKNKDEFFFMTNPNKCLFTCICWDDKHKLLYMSDAQGCVYIANVYMGEKYTIKKQVVNCEIRKINVYQDILFVFTDRAMKSFRIKMGQKTHDIEGHTDSILKIIALEPQRLEQKL